MPLLASLAVMLPAALATMEPELLRQSWHRPAHKRRAICRRALLLFTASGLMLTVVHNLWARPPKFRPLLPNGITEY